MGLFRRAKGRPNDGQRGMLRMVQKRSKVQCDECSIGDELALDDQFDLYVPLKRPTGILKNTSFEIVQRRRCIELQRDRKDYTSTANVVEDIETSSTVSSLTIPALPTKLSSEGTQLALKREKSDKTTDKQTSKDAFVNSKSSWCNPCCGVSEQTEATDDTNSIVAGRHKTKPPAKKPPLSYWSIICAPRNETSYINDDQTAPILLKRPLSLRKETSLFDSLQDEENDIGGAEAETETEAGAGTTIAVVEMDSTHGEEQSVVTTNSKWKLKFPSVRSLPKIRSIPKIRSFKLGKKKKKPQYVQPYDLD